MINNRKPIVVIAMPASDGVEGPTAIELAALCAHAAPDFDVRPVYAEYPNVARARNMAVSIARMHRAEWLLQIDADMRFPKDTLHRLTAHDKDIIAAIYPMRKPPHLMLGMALNGEEAARQDGIAEMFNIPAGIMLTRMTVFDMMDRPYFKFPVRDEEIGGEDYDFCERAREAGFKIYNDIDLSKEIRHIGTTDYGYDSGEVQKTMEEHKENEAKAMITPISISVLIPSRGRPEMLKMTVMALDHLASDNNKITYCIATDVDDVPTGVAVQVLARESGNVNVYMGDRPGGIGKLYNEMAAKNPADAYVLFADDMLPLVQDWDVLVAKGIEQFPVLAWYDHFNPRMPTYPIISKAWYEAAGKIYPECFAFWFNDTALNEVVTMVTGNGIPIAKDMPVGGRRGRTHRLRDLGVWCDFFRVTRIDRMNEAKAIAEKIGIPSPPVNKMSLKFESNDLWLARNIERFEAIYGENLKPTPEYLELLEVAKARIGAAAAA